MPARAMIVEGGRLRLDRCPDHLTVGALERCSRCMSVFHAQLDRLRALDAAGAVPPIPVAPSVC